jgi:hypothetical protein
LQAQLQFQSGHRTSFGDHARTECHVASFPAGTVPEFIAYAKANPGRVIYLYRRAKSVTASTLAETAWAAVDFLLVPTGIAFVGVMVTISTMLSWDGRL